MRDKVYYERILRKLTPEQVRAVYILSRNNWTRGRRKGVNHACHHACRALVRMGLAEEDSNDIYRFYSLNKDGYQIQRLLWGLDVEPEK